MEAAGAGQEPGQEAASSGPSWAPGYRHLTSEHAPIKLRFREEPEHFVVEEVPLYPAEGAGEHVFFTIEKRGLSTPEAARRIATALGRRDSEIGWAGRKDAHAVTRQRLSLQGVTPAELLALELPGIRIVDALLHRNKLRVGQLAGNRFRLLLRGIAAADRARLERVLAEVEQHGMPNYYGAQRFGRGGRTWLLGRLLLQGRHADYLCALASSEHSPPSAVHAELRRVVVEGTRGEHRRLKQLAGQLDSELAAVVRQLARRPFALDRAVASISKRTRIFHISALQSRVFNRVLSQRMESLECLEPGDVAYVHDKGASFLVGEEEDAAELQRRLDGFELSPSGPLPGGRSLSAGGRVGALEAAALAREDLDIESFSQVDRHLAPRGARRPLRVPLTEFELSGGPPGSAAGDLLLAFRLPPGSFATSLLEELRKEHAPQPTPPAS